MRCGCLAAKYRSKAPDTAIRLREPRGGLSEIYRKGTALAGSRPVQDNRARGYIRRPLLAQQKAGENGLGVCVASVSQGVAESVWKPLKRKENCCDTLQHQGG
jgi:hypothetical protein